MEHTFPLPPGEDTWHTVIEDQKIYGLSSTWIADRESQYALTITNTHTRATQWRITLPRTNCSKLFEQFYCKSSSWFLWMNIRRFKMAFWFFPNETKRSKEIHWISDERWRWKCLKKSIAFRITLTTDAHSANVGTQAPASMYRQTQLPAIHICGTERCVINSRNTHSHGRTRACIRRLKPNDEFASFACWVISNIHSFFCLDFTCDRHVHVRRTLTFERKKSFRFPNGSGVAPTHTHT